ncbi:TIGR01777 family oxidoreductase [Natronosporangium hydrolyticum]|uniref:TIGR01777 family oxidoreductase n=1 Tax=Natronosporangium hydrolyticum TaxID=2811111 RepID=A0A895YFW0_9ACTN|nr:TIGR01777 family oxidoreductase [Natronosporangium hydrolyticum]QSB16461.1 TIGR01777 family oxidoreductase [Natronosporangium hydrolyticum]
MRVLVAGGSGFLGAALVGWLTGHGHQVLRLVRRQPAAPDERRWQPGAAPLDPATVADVDAVVNLAGSSLGTRVGPVRVPVRLWTPSYRREFRASRVDATATLAEAIATADPKPRAFLAGSAVGWYGDTGDTVTDESSPPGDSYFAATSRDWEQAAAPAEAAGVRVAYLRTGMPLHRSGGMFAPLRQLFRLGLGGRIGDGRQWQPLLSLADWLAAVDFVLHTDTVAGPVNLVGPQPVTNREFTAAMGRLLRRPTVLPAPAPLLVAALGEFGRDALGNHRVVPNVLTGAGFTFEHPELEAILQAALAPLPTGRP